MDHALQEAHLWITGLGCKILIRLGHGLRELSIAHQLRNICVVVGMGYSKRQGSGQCNPADCGKKRGWGLLHSAFENLLGESPSAQGFILRAL